MKRRRTLLAPRAARSAAREHGAQRRIVARGEELFSLCAHCHGDHGQGKPLALAPSIAGLEQWYVVKQLQNFKDGVRAMHFDDLAGMRMRPMARWLKTPEDVSAVAAYVSSLPPVPIEITLVGGDPARGAALYATCAGCHGLKGEGVEPVGAPSLQPHQRLVPAHADQELPAGHPRQPTRATWAARRCAACRCCSPTTRRSRTCSRTSRPCRHPRAEERSRRWPRSILPTSWPSRLFAMCDGRHPGLGRGGVLLRHPEAVRRR